MLTIIEGLPDDVLGFIADGELTNDDYADVLMPSIEAKFLQFNKVGVLFQLAPGFRKFSLAFIEDETKLGLEHYSGWNKVAIVSDHHLINAYTNLIRHVLPVNIRVFETSEFGRAMLWLAIKP
jgi:hypothetical protein